MLSLSVHFFPLVAFFRFCFRNSDIFRHICTEPSSDGLISVKLSHFPLVLCRRHKVVFSLVEHVKPSPVYWLTSADKNRFISQWSRARTCQTVSHIDHQYFPVGYKFTIEYYLFGTFRTIAAIFEHLSHTERIIVACGIMRVPH